MQETIKHLMELIKRECQQITNYYQGGEFKSDIFDTPCSFLASVSEEELKKNIKKLRARHGIYIFVMKNNLFISSQQMLEWNKVKSAHIKFSCNPQDINAKENDCFYIGSCCKKSLETRIQDHFKANNASSLKLNNCKREWIKNSLMVYCFPIKSIFDKEVIQMILHTIEKHLHNDLKAIAGSSRV